MDTAEKLLIAQVSGNRSPSVQYALFNKDSIIKSYAFGFADIDNKIEVDLHTTYNAYSVTKTFTALAVLQLAQEGKLGINDPVRNYLQDIPFSSDITIKQVLTHSAGIPNPIPLSWIYPVNNKNFNRDQFFKGVISKNSRTRSEPNEKYAYSNLGYVLLGQIIEKASGLIYENYIQCKIINALGIPVNELGFEIRDYTKHAKGYHRRAGFSNLILGFFIDKSEYMGKSGPIWKPFNPFYVMGASYGGLIGTPGSFIKYIQNLLSPDFQLITNEYRKLLFTENYTTNNKPTGMCISWFKGQLNGQTYFAHAGGGGGYYCEIRIYPETGLGSVVFFNRTGMSDERFLDSIDKTYLEN